MPNVYRFIFGPKPRRTPRRRFPFFAAAGGATTAWKDAVARFRLRVGAYRDAGARFRLQVAAFKDAGARLRLAARAYRDATARFRLQAGTYRDAATRPPPDRHGVPGRCRSRAHRGSEL
jgi:hypothetical protein